MDTNYFNKIIDFKCSVEIISSKSISELGQIISDSIFGGIPLEGLEAKVYNEVPAIFFRRDLIGLEVTLFGYPVGTENGLYFLEILPNHKLGYHANVQVDLSYYIFRLLSIKLKGMGDVELKNPNASDE